MSSRVIKIEYFAITKGRSYIMVIFALNCDSMKYFSSTLSQMNLSMEDWRQASCILCSMTKFFSRSIATTD